MPTDDPAKARLVVFGTGGHAKSVSEAATAQGFLVEAYIALEDRLLTFLGCPVYQKFEQEFADRGFLAIVAIGDNFTRERLQVEHAQTWPALGLATVVHPSASVAMTAKLGSGAVVLQGAVVGSHAEIGAGVVVNTGALVDHDCHVQPFASLGPGATLGGSVRIGRRSAIGIGATVSHGVAVGDDTVIGAASYVHSSVESGVVAYGVPARVIRPRAPGNNYLA